MENLKDKIIKLIEHNARSKVADFSTAFARGQSEEKENTEDKKE